jgi:hypothetical protein
MPTDPKIDAAVTKTESAVSFAFKRSKLILGLPPWVRQTVKTQFAVRCKFLDRQDHFNAF